MRLESASQDIRTGLLMLLRSILHEVLLAWLVLLMLEYWLLLWRLLLVGIDEQGRRNRSIIVSPYHILRARCRTDAG